MAEPLKEMFNAAYFGRLATELTKIHPSFRKEEFLKEVHQGHEGRSLNERMRHASLTLQKYLPQAYPLALEIMKELIPHMDRGYTSLLFPDFVGVFGLSHFDDSLDALKYFTQFGSSEFAIREFLRKDFEKTLEVMHTWAEDENVHVRRLSSEGSRPRLPWSFKLDRVIQNPKLTLPILEKLKADKELYVRKSVANHLNDISKEAPELSLQILQNWKGYSKETDWILKHGARTLLKRGDAQVLEIFGVGGSSQLVIRDFDLGKDSVHIGAALPFSFTLYNEGTINLNARIEFAVYYRKKSGELSKKVFKISERTLEPLQEIHLEKSVSFKLITTRVFHLGIHSLSIIVNGKESSQKEFVLLP